jgi:hypothetical protein
VSNNAIEYDKTLNSLTWWASEYKNRMFVKVEACFEKEAFCSNQKKYYYDAVNK